MALAIRSLFPLPIPFSSHSRRRPRHLCFRATMRAGEGLDEGAAVVWFKHDLRVDDHPGLVAATARHRTIVPVYVFDHRILSGFSDEMLQLLLFALEDLKKLLKDQGSDLLIGYGRAEHAITKLVNEVKAVHVFAEEEVEHKLCRVIDVVESSLSAGSFTWGSPKCIFWSAPFYDVKNLKEIPSVYNDFQKLRLPLTVPLAAPTLPVLTIDLDKGVLPTFDDLRSFISADPCRSEESWISIKNIPAKSILQKGKICQMEMKTDISEGIDSLENNEKVTIPTSNNVEKKYLMNSVFASRKGNQVRGGTDVVLNALAAYLRYLEGTARDDWQELHEKARMAESRTGASFAALFGSALYLGIISRRRVHYEAIKYERERNAGFLSPFGYSAPTVAASVDAICSMEWYWLLALKSQNCNEGMYPIRLWRWNGYLIQYTVVGNEGPAVLFVHGFGAFLEHFRSNISCIADGGNRVWAITLLGFGKSEKPNIGYTELMWAELLRDFIVDIVGEPAHIVGNSIGGYFVATVAGLWPILVKSLVLLNTAGSIVPGYSSIRLTEVGKSSGVAWIGSRLLLLYLRLRAGNILRDCYPVNPGRVDSWLIKEILRASYDPGVPAVMESVISFKLSVPLNYLLKSFGGKVLIAQGMKDPLSKTKVRLAMLREHCSGLTIRELDAGHCPHDEVPEEVNSVLSKWINTAETKLGFAERV